jgi:hypothetical protein
MFYCKCTGFGKGTSSLQTDDACTKYHEKNINVITEGNSVTLEVTEYMSNYPHWVDLEMINYKISLGEYAGLEYLDISRNLDSQLPAHVVL